MTNRNKDGYNDVYNETSNTAAGINTPKDYESLGPLGMVSDAVEQIVDQVQHSFDHQDERMQSDSEEYNDFEESDHHAHLNQHNPRYDQHSY